MPDFSVRRLPSGDFEVLLPPGPGSTTGDGRKPCVCGQPTAPGVVHRADGPCYLRDMTWTNSHISTVWMGVVTC